MNPGAAATKLTAAASVVAVPDTEADSINARDGERVWMRSEKWALWTLLLLASPYYLNDFANIYLSDWRLWLLIDYVLLKLLPGFYLCWLIRRRRLLSAAQLGLRPQRVAAFLLTAALLSLAAILIDQNAYRWLEGWPGYRPLGHIPTITDPLWNWIDLTLGLLAVGVFEELVFRGYLHHFMAGYSARPAVILVVSSAAFGLIHWSHGLHTVLITALIGALFMAVYQRTRSLYAPILAHFLVNFVAYSGVVPPRWFRLF